MSILSGLSGNASEIDLEKLQREIGPVLVEGESLQRAFKVIRDLFVFTDRRLILVDKQGMTGKKVEYLSLPYRSITRFSVETVGTFDRDSELKIWISGDHTPVSKDFKRGTDILGLQQTLAQFVLR